uniref:Uncharacterized protein n=1 Tax=Quercus lobata TaxID=97700 RepID=A0A7N2N7H9_QUELO
MCVHLAVCLGIVIPVGMWPCMYADLNECNNRSWLDPKKLRALRKGKNYSQRVDLIQDLRFETATTKIKATPDGEFLIASGLNMKPVLRANGTPYFDPLLVFYVRDVMHTKELDMPIIQVEMELNLHKTLCHFLVAQLQDLEPNVSRKH